MFHSVRALLLCCLAFPSLLLAGYNDASTLPDKPVAKWVNPLLEAMNSGDPGRMEVFIRENFTPRFLAAFSMEQHLGFMTSTHTQYGALRFQSVRDYDRPVPDNELVVIVNSFRKESWHAVTLFVDAAHDNKIDGMRFQAARVPKNLPQAELSDKQLLAELAGYAKRMTDRDVFSGTILLAKGDKILHRSAHGLASKRFNVANNVQTKFNLGSMNKMFTSMAILQLVEAGKLSLQDKLSQYADETWLARDVSEKIEIRHLLTHSSGLGNYFNRTYAESSKNNFRALADYKPLIENDTLQFEPGTDTRYSNTGMFMLGVVIEAVSGKDYFTYMREHLYQPAGMINTDAYEMDQPVPNLAIGYEPQPGAETGWRNNLYDHVLKGGPAGGGFSTVDDLHRFARALTRYKLVGKTLTEDAYSAKPELQSKWYGYGFGIDGTPEDRIVGHAGGFAGISANLDVFLDSGYVAVVLSNYGGGADPVKMKIRELLARVRD